MKKDLKEIYLTSEGFLKLEEELNEAKTVKRPQIIKDLKEARAQGDLSENAEYSAARDAQGKLEARIKEIEYLLEHATIIENNKYPIFTSLDLGTHYKNFYGTYIIGPILARNPMFLEHFIKELVTSKNKKFKFKKFDLQLDKKARKSYMETYH